MYQIFDFDFLEGSFLELQIQQAEVFPTIYSKLLKFSFV